LRDVPGLYSRLMSKKKALTPSSMLAYLPKRPSVLISPYRP
jgi:hypothetical protein